MGPLTNESMPKTLSLFHPKTGKTNRVTNAYVGFVFAQGFFKDVAVALVHRVRHNVNGLQL